MSSVELWIRPHSELVLENGKVFCRPCHKIISASKKFIVDQHVKTSGHVQKMGKNLKGTQRSAKVQQTLTECVVRPQKSDQQVFNEQLCEALIAADIPFSKLQNPKFSSFLEKYCHKNIPCESTLRKNYVTKCYENTFSDIKASIGDNSVYITVDETTDASGKYIAHFLIGALQERSPGKSFLIASRQLERTNNLTVTRFIQETISNFYLPNLTPYEKILLMVSDAAPYMVKCANNLKCFYPNLIHVTCLAHGVNLVAQQIKDNFPLVNRLISKTKKIFVKAPVRVQFYKENLPNTPLPPEPIITRWGTWLRAAMFYADNFEDIKSVILQLNDSSCAALAVCKEVLQSKELPQQLAFIKGNYSFVPEVIVKLEKQGMPLAESVGLVDEFQQKCKSVKGNIGANVLKKLTSVLEKNAGYSFLSNVNKICQGEFIEDLDISPGIISKLKYAPITSVDVERSFSVYKNMYTDKRRKFLVENFERHIVVKCFNV